jgi:WD40 repeat protein
VLKPAAELERHRAAVTCVAFSPSGALLATADSNREVLLWDTQSMQVDIASASARLGLPSHQTTAIAVA